MIFRVIFLLSLCFCITRGSSQVTMEETYPGGRTSVKVCGITNALDSGYVIGGHYFVSGMARKFAAKINPCGEMIWRKDIISSGNSYASDIKTGADNSYYIGGSVYDGIAWRMHVVKLDPAGNVIWDKNYHYWNSEHNCYGKFLITEPDSNVWIGGYESPTPYKRNRLYAHLNSNGTDFEGNYASISTSTDSSNTGIRTMDGNIAFDISASWTRDIRKGEHFVYHYWAVPINFDIKKLIELPDSSLVGFGNSPSGLEWVRISNSGSVIWRRSHSVSGNPKSLSAICTSDNNILFTGVWARPGSLCSEGLGVIKADFNGDVLWSTVLFPQSMCVASTSVIEESPYEYTFAGLTGTSPADIYITRIGGDICDPIFVGVPEDENAFATVYPVPARESASIQLPAAHVDVRVEIFDLMGRSLTGFNYNISLTPQGTLLNFDLSAVPPSSYLYLVTSGNTRYSGKLVKE